MLKVKGRSCKTCCVTSIIFLPKKYCSIRDEKTTHLRLSAETPHIKRNAITETTKCPFLPFLRSRQGRRGPRTFSGNAGLRSREDDLLNLPDNSLPKIPSSPVAPTGAKVAIRNKKKKRGKKRRRERPSDTGPGFDSPVRPPETGSPPPASRRASGSNILLMPEPGLLRPFFVGAGRRRGP